MMPNVRNPDDYDRHRRIVTEILEPVDVYQEAAGPEGPWFYRSLRVQRVMNQIRVYDVDGNLWDTIPVDYLGDDSHADLRETLDEWHELSLAEL